MSDTKTNRKYAWGLQTDFATQKAIAAGAYKQIICTDDNVLEHSVDKENNEDWSHGVNSATDQWTTAHDTAVQHQIPGFAQELGKAFYLSMSDTITTPPGGTNSRKHTFVPTDPSVTRQDPAVSYVEKLGSGSHRLAPSMVADGFTLSGNGAGVLLCDLNLKGSGKVVENPAITYPPTATPTVQTLTGLAKLFNSRMTLTPNDGGTYNTAYGCAYRSFQIAFKKTLLEQAGYKPGCQNFFVANDPTSGIIRSALEFDKQMLDFNFDIDLPANTPEYDCVKDQRPINLTFDILGGLIEATIRHQLTVKITAAKYDVVKAKLADGIWQLGIQGKAFFDTGLNKLFTIELTTDVLNYATAW